MPSFDVQFVVTTSFGRHTSRGPHYRNCGFEKRKADPGVHDDDEAERREVDVGEENRGVDFSHLLIGPIFPTPVERLGIVVVQHDPYPVLLCDLEHDA